MLVQRQQQSSSWLRLFPSVKHRYTLRIEAMQMQLEFKEKAQDLKSSIDNLILAIDGKCSCYTLIILFIICHFCISSTHFLQQPLELMACDILPDILYVVLVIGNIINGVRYMSKSKSKCAVEMCRRFICGL